MQLSPVTQLKAIRKDARRFIASIEILNPSFELNIGWAKNYDELFANHVSITSELSIIEHAFHRGRVILVGPGGSGKTQLLYRLLRTAKDVVPVFLDLRLWTKPDYDGWLSSKIKSDGGVGFLLKRFSKPSISALELDWIPPTEKKLLLVDGLNEISAPVGQEILNALDELVSSQIQTSVIVADRLARRELTSPDRWDLGRVQPLSDDFLSKYNLSKSLNRTPNDLIRLPIFLAGVLSAGKTAPHSATLQDFLGVRAGLRGPALDATALAAFEAYKGNMTRTFSFSQFSRTAGTENTNHLVERAVLRRIGDSDAQFDHHLLHDYFAAHYLACRSEEEWTADNLDAISFRGSSFDTIALVFSQLTGERADAFLRRIYDWNLYAAGYSLGEQRADSSAPTAEMQAVICAMLGEKRFDPVLATKRRASDGLLLMQSQVSAPYREAITLEELFEATNSVNSNIAWFTEWRRVFTRPRNSVATDHEIETLRSPDSVMGWTWANVLRRLSVTEGQQAALRQLLFRENTSVVRWRIAHVLGSFPSCDNVHALLGLLDTDPDEMVQYGAVRSLAEIAFRAEDVLRAMLVGEIKKRVGALSRRNKIMDELKRALIVDPALGSQKWRDIVADITRSFYQNSDDPAERDRWRRYLLAVDSVYSSINSAV